MSATDVRAVLDETEYFDELDDDEKDAGLSNVMAQLVRVGVAEVAPGGWLPGDKLHPPVEEAPPPPQG